MKPIHTALLIVAIAASLSGCVRRRMTITSNPPGAVVLVDKVEVGRTPVSVDFTYYATREIKLIADGYETLTVNQPFAVPWYEYPVIDFFSENVVPWEIRDEHVLSYNLTPQVVVPTEQLLDRANEIRNTAQAGAAGQVISAPAGQPVPANTLPPPPTMPGTLPPGGQPPVFVP